MTISYAPRRLQKEPVIPRSPRRASVSSRVCRRQSGLNLSLYQPWASRHPCSGLRTPPRGRSRVMHHRSMCASDRKRSIVVQVNPMLSHQ